MNTPSNAPKSDFTNIHSMWDGFGRHYNGAAIGGILVNGKPYQFRITQFNTTNTENMPTNRRVFTEMAPDLDTESDHTAIYFPGFGETSAQMEGDPASVIFESLQNAGYLNPKLISLNPCGRGTREYMEHVDLISRIGVLDEIKDVRELVWMLLCRRKVQGDVSLITHSMGTLDVMGSLDVLKGKVKNMAQLMPCTDKPIGLTFSPRFLWTVRKHLRASLGQAYRKEGAVLITEPDHNRMMFSIKSKENEAGGVHDFNDHCESSVTDSSRRFVGIALNGKRLPRDIVTPEACKGIKAHVMQAGQDAVIPDSMVRNQVKCLKRMGMVVQGDKPFIAKSFPHAIPMRMTPEQRGEFGEFLGGVFKR